MAMSVLIYVGAGSGESLDLAELEQFDEVLLLEPHPLLEFSLMKMTRAMPNVSVLEQALVTDVDTSKLFSLASPGFCSGFFQPTGLLERYPGLRLVKQKPVEQTTFRQLLDQRSECVLTVRLDCAGNELALVSSLLTESKETVSLATVEIAVSSGSPDFENSACEAQLRDLLAANYFEAQSSSCGKDRLLLTGTYSRVLKKDAEHAAQVARLDAEIAASKNQALSLSAELLTADERQKTREVEADKQISDLKQALAESTAVASNATSQLIAAQAERQKQLDENKLQLETIAKERATAVGRVEILESELSGLREDLESKSSRIGELENKLKTAKESLSLSEQALEKLNKENQELDYRQSMLDQEIVRAESQLELIKDVVLREKAF